MTNGSRMAPRGTSPINGARSSWSMRSLDRARGGCAGAQRRDRKVGANLIAPGAETIDATELHRYVDTLGSNLG